MSGSGDLRALSIDLSAMVRRSVATLYSHLVTRPTGHALRLGIESQIGEVEGPCLSVLDFRQVVIMDYSCADEAVAKLLQRYLRNDDPTEVYFLARGVGERHRETIEAVLERHGLGLVAALDDEPIALLGAVNAFEREIWMGIETRRRVPADDLDSAGRRGEVRLALDSLVSRRLLLRTSGVPSFYVALSSLLPALDDG